MSQNGRLKSVRKAHCDISTTARDEVGRLVTYFVYILECRDRSLYVGSTNGLDRRLEQHNNSKKGAHYTKIRRPVVLRYKEEYFTLMEARSREAELKRWRREKKLNLISRQR